MTTATAIPNEQCPICAFEIERLPNTSSPTRVQQLLCQHQLCVSCFDEYYLNKLENGSVPIKCPLCTATISPNDVQSSITSGDYEKWTLLLQKQQEAAAAMEQNAEAGIRQLGYKQCPGCRMWIEKDGGCNHVKCRCGTELCYGCGRRYPCGGC
eukprot:c4820_g1_i1.p1 GENE.c4820_g1_i1~~c4820_g1_i1.p1  ORF type:complete len:154 (+),score=11.76 c4820_g1_i1:260-721(+)